MDITERRQKPRTKDNHGSPLNDSMLSMGSRMQKIVIRPTMRYRTRNPVKTLMYLATVKKQASQKIAKLFKYIEV